MHLASLARQSASVAIATVAMSVAFAERPLPTTWWALANSVNSDDLGLVKQLRALKWYDACIEWGRGTRSSKTPRRQAALQLMLESDRMLNELDIKTVPKKDVLVGMTTCGVLAVLGKPNDNNTTTTATVTSAQMVYRSRGLYVYTDAPPNQGNGIVRAIQR
jgi:hypothetical protein